MDIQINVLMFQLFIAITIGVLVALVAVFAPLQLKKVLAFIKSLLRPDKRPPEGQ